MGKYYRGKKELKKGGFVITVYPFVRVPDNVFEDNVALQYGADFQVFFKRGGAKYKNKIGLVQLIKPQTKVFDHTKIDEWNVDKQEQPVGSKIILMECLYGNDQDTIVEI